MEIHLTYKLKKYWLECVSWVGSIKIHYTWSCSGIMEILVENLEDAIELARERGELPQGKYIDESFEIDYESLELMQEGSGV